jgi:uncharacterized membrane protein YphA (DoxX/SURF4 family)
MAHPREGAVRLEMPAWKSALGTISAVIVSVLFVVAGVWEILDPLEGAARLAQAHVPESLSVPAALLLGIGNTIAGVWILVPRFRRWGALLASLLLAVFIGYFAINYHVLRGDECGCFPWLKRVVGPGFFIGDGLMLLVAVIAGVWSKPPESKRSAALVMSAVAVFALVSYGVTVTHQSGLRAPSFIEVAGKPASLHNGKVFLFFFNPSCLHCDAAARVMAGLNWGDTRLIVIPVEEARFAGQFVEGTGLRAEVSFDVEKLRKTFTFVDSPYAVALENGRQKAAITNFEKQELVENLRKLGFVN